MKITKKFLIQKCGHVVAKAALAVGKDSVTRSHCFIWYYQPKVPKTMDRFKK